MAVETLIEEQTASSSASIDFTTGISASYGRYRLYIADLLPATNGISYFFRVSTDGGSTWKSGAADYMWAGLENNGNSADSEILMATHGQGNAATEESLFMVDLIRPASTAAWTYLVGEVAGGTTTNGITASFLSGCYKATTAVDGLQITCSSGNIATGNFKLFGVQTS